MKKFRNLALALLFTLATLVPGALAYGEINARGVAVMPLDEVVEPGDPGNGGGTDTGGGDGGDGGEVVDPTPNPTPQPPTNKPGNNGGNNSGNNNNGGTNGNSQLNAGTGSNQGYQEASVPIVQTGSAQTIMMLVAGTIVTGIALLLTNRKVIVTKLGKDVD